MQKTKIIKEIIGKRIEPYGFHYLKTDGTTRIFVREVKGIKRYYDPEVDVVKQYINIQESRFAKELVVRLSTDAYGHGGEIELKEQGRCGGWMEYTDEGSYKEVLVLLSRLIVKYAFDLLDGISVEEEEIPTKDMADQLRHQSKKLEQSLIEEFHIKVIPETIQDIDEWERLIKQLITDSLKFPYEEVKGLLTKIAAFIGERACEVCSSEWFDSDTAKTPWVSGYYVTVAPLDMLVYTWKERKCGKTWERLEMILNEFKKGLLKQL